MKNWKIIKKLQAKNIQQALKREKEGEITEIFEDINNPDLSKVETEKRETGF